MTTRRLPLRQALRITGASVRDTVRADVPGTQRGVALLVALVTVAVMAALSTEFAYNTRTNIWMTGNITAATQAHFHARSATRIALLAVNARKNFPQMQQALSIMGAAGNRLEIWRQACEFVKIFSTGRASFFGMDILDLSNEKAVGASRGEFSCEVVAEDGRINLNAAATPTPALGGLNNTAQPGRPAPGAANIANIQGRNQLGLQLLGLFTPFTLSGELDGDQAALELALNIMDWTDADDTKTDIGPDGNFMESGASEAADYGRYGYQAKNAKFDTVGEVQLVEGMTTDVYCKVRDDLTVFATDNKLNVNDASALSLRGVLCQAIPEQFRWDWCGLLPGRVAPIDQMLSDLHACRELKKAAYSTPFSVMPKFTQFLQAWPQAMGLPPVFQQQIVNQQLGTDAKMVRIEAQGAYWWGQGICGGGEGQRCEADSDCGEGGQCVRRKTRRKMTTVVDTSTGSLVYFKTE